MLLSGVLLRRTLATSRFPITDAMSKGVLPWWSTVWGLYVWWAPPGSEVKTADRSRVSSNGALVADVWCRAAFGGVKRGLMSRRGPAKVSFRYLMRCSGKGWSLSVSVSVGRRCFRRKWRNRRSVRGSSEDWNGGSLEGDVNS